MAHMHGCKRYGLWVQQGTEEIQVSDGRAFDADLQAWRRSYEAGPRGPPVAYARGLWPSHREGRAMSSAAEKVFRFRFEAAVGRRPVASYSSQAAPAKHVGHGINIPTQPEAANHHGRNAKNAVRSPVRGACLPSASMCECHYGGPNADVPWQRSQRP